MKLSALAVETIDLLHAIEAAPDDASAASVARATGRDKSNAAKTIGRMREHGLLHAEGLALTEPAKEITRLIAVDGEVLAPTDIVMRAYSELRADPENDRTEFDPDELDTLRADIVAKGVLQNLVISPDGMIIAGERRWRAVGLAIDEGDWPADRLIPCQVKGGLSPLDRALMRLAENLQRADLHMLDEGDAFKRLIDQHGLSTQDIADEVGKSRKHVQDRIALVTKLSEDDKARMRLPKDSENYLAYGGVDGARHLIQAHKEKPAVDVTAKEALVLLELADRCKAKPSHDPAFHGRAGWTQLRELPAGGAASSLIDKGFIEIREAPYGPQAFARTKPDHIELKAWFAARAAEPDALWSIRSEVVTPLVAGDLVRLERYATPWLNSEPLPAPSAPPSPQTATPSAPPPLPPAEAEQPPPTSRQIRKLVEIAHRIDDLALHATRMGLSVNTDPDYAALRQAALITDWWNTDVGGAEVKPSEAGYALLGEMGLDPRVNPEALRQAYSDDGLYSNVHDLVRSNGGYQTSWLGSELLTPANPVREPAAELPLAAAEPEVPDLADAQARILCEITRKIAEAGEQGPADAYFGARAFAYHRDAEAQKLLFARLIRFAPDRSRAGYLVCLTDLGRAWALAHADDVAAVTDYQTEWLSPPAAAPDAPAGHSGPLARIIGDDFSNQMRAATAEDEIAPFPRRERLPALGMVEMKILEDGRAELKLDEWPFKLTRANATTLRDLLNDTIVELGAREEEAQP